MLHHIPTIGEQLVHEVLGRVTFTTAAAEAQQGNTDPDTLCVWHAGEVKNVSRNLLWHTPLQHVPQSLIDSLDNQGIGDELREQGLM